MRCQRLAHVLFAIVWMLGEGVSPGAAPGTKGRPRGPTTYPGMEADAPWRAEARRRIEQHRMADVQVRVLDAAGKPIAGAEVQVRMKRHAFGFGSAVVLQTIATPGGDGDTYRRHIFELFNRVVNENDLKWPAWDGEWRGGFTKERSLAALKLLRERGFYIRGHCMVWPSWRNVPRAAADLKGNPDELRKLIRDHILELGGKTRGMVDEWDVINEPFSNHDLMDVLGKEAMVEWYKAAREAAPEARLFINDYAILAAGGATDTPHQRHYEETIRFLLDKGAPLGGIGLQSHFSVPTPPETLWKILDRFAKFGLPLEVTEFDYAIDDEKLQAQFTRDFMTAIFAHPAVEGFVMWGFWEGRHWRPNAAMFRRDWTIRPNGQAYKDLVFKDWWTDAKGTTDPAGAFRTRGFLGDYEITVTAGGASKTVPLKLAKAGAKLDVAMGGR